MWHVSSTISLLQYNFKESSPYPFQYPCYFALQIIIDKVILNIVEIPGWVQACKWNSLAYVFEYLKYFIDVCKC